MVMPGKQCFAGVKDKEPNCDTHETAHRTDYLSEVSDERFIVTRRTKSRDYRFVHPARGVSIGQS